MKKMTSLILLMVGILMVGCGQDPTAGGSASCDGLFCDDFNRSAGPLGNNWITTSGIDGSTAYNPAEIQESGGVSAVAMASYDTEVMAATSSSDNLACNTTEDGGASENRYYGALQLSNLDGVNTNNFRVRTKVRTGNVKGWRTYITAYDGADITDYFGRGKIGLDHDCTEYECPAGDDLGPCGNNNGISGEDEDYGECVGTEGGRLEIDLPGVSSQEGNTYAMELNKDYTLESDFVNGDITVKLYNPSGTLMGSVSLTGENYVPQWVGFVVGQRDAGVSCVDDYQISNL